MATRYEECSGEIYKMADILVRRGHPDLAAANAQLTLVFAYNEETPPIISNGYPAIAQIKKTNLLNRVCGLKDAIIIIDGKKWAEWSEERRRAVLDGELYRLEVQRDKEGAIKEDDAGRPVLALKTPDFKIEGFDEMVRRHGPEAIEAEAITTIINKWGELEFNFERPLGAR